MEVKLLAIRKYSNSKNETEYFVPSLNLRKVYPGNYIVDHHKMLIDFIYSMLDSRWDNGLLEDTLLGLGWLLQLYPFNFRQPEEIHLKDLETATGFTAITISFKKYYHE